ncbi:GntR family transcriptional regulator [Streptomyces albus]|uniref:GntR family transcriptional regulator n=1 Tax=Streptomyces albus TaxID=1888 RepID=UPI0034083E9A
MTPKTGFQRPAPLYAQLAQHLAEQIKDGTYSPGDLLPSESQMEREFGVSKPTIRQALASLRSMGLTEVRQGKGSIVRGVAAAQGQPVSRAIYRATTRKGPKWSLPTHPMEAEAPSVTRMAIEGTPASLLDQADQDAFCVERLLTDADTKSRMSHRMLIPLAVAAEIPALAEAPDAPIAELYQHCADAGHPLTWEEQVTARMPLPDERTTLRLPDAAPLLVTYRVTYGTDTRPLLCEELRAPATSTRLVFPVMPTKAPKKAPRQSA